MEQQPVFDERPILIVGAARSGTHLLASTLARNLDVAYTGEVNELWKRYVPATAHDVLPAHYATPEVIRKTRKAFLELKASLGGGRLMEKTPATSLRLPFVTRVFPEALLIHIVRDGRDVAVSARKKYRGDYRKITRLDHEPDDLKARFERLTDTVIAKARHGFSFAHLWRNAGRYLGGVLSLLNLKKKRIWGPRFPGHERYFQEYSLIEVSALQWRESVLRAKSFLAGWLGEYCEIRYEDLIAKPDDTLATIARFLGDNGCEVKPPFEHDVIPGTSTWKEELTEEEKLCVSYHIEAVLQCVGYEQTFPTTGKPLKE